MGFESSRNKVEFARTYRMRRGRMFQYTSSILPTTGTAARSSPARDLAMRRPGRWILRACGPLRSGSARTSQMCDPAIEMRLDEASYFTVRLVDADLINVPEAPVNTTAKVP